MVQHTHLCIKDHNRSHKAKSIISPFWEINQYVEEIDKE